MANLLTFARLGGKHQGIGACKHELCGPTLVYTARVGKPQVLMSTFDILLIIRISITSRSNVWTQGIPRSSQSMNEGARKFRAYRSRSFFSSANGIFRQLNVTETGRITTLRRPKGMDLNVRLNNVFIRVN
jgi:hypothetical protein